MSRFWDSRRSAILPNSRMVHFQQNGIFHALACDGAGDISLHIIEENNDPDAAANLIAKEGLNDAGSMLVSNPFVLMPSAFEYSEFEEFPGGNLKKVTIEKDLSLAVGNCPEGTAFHAIIPLFHIAKKQAALHKEFVYSCILNENVLVLFFRDGICELANVFPAKNDSEVLYFCVAPIKKAGLRVDQVKFEFLAEPDNIKSLMRTTDRFLPHTSIARLDLPYVAGEYPPYATIAYLLYQYLQCELPEAL